MIGIDGQGPLPWQTEPLARTLAHQRGHALLLHAAAGEGAFEFALALAQSWLCEARESGAAAATPACGRCDSCRLVQQQVHPDLMVLLPEALALELGWPVDVPSDRKPSKQLRIEQIREQAIPFAATTTGRGRGKVLVLHPATSMNEVSASALLKTLEEPGPGVRLILTAADPQRLLPTVRSRCQIVRLPPPRHEVALAWLAGQDVADALVLLAAAGGRPLDAAVLFRRGITAHDWSRLPAAMSAGDARALAGWPVPAAIDALLKLCHDAMRLAGGAEPVFFAAAAWPKKAWAIQSLKPLAAWQRELLRVARHAEHPWNEGLLIDALVTLAQAALAGDGRGPALPASAFDTLAV